MNRKAVTDHIVKWLKDYSDQIGATYPELEWTMNYVEKNESYPLNERQKMVMGIYKKRNAANKHKMEPIPVCIIPKELKN